MARGPKKHLKRINTPRSWLLSKMGGIYATRPSQGPHRLRECLPLAVILKYIHLYPGIILKSPSPADKPTLSCRIRSQASRSTVRSEEISNSPSEPWTSSLLSRPERATDSSTTSREDSFSTKSKRLNPNSNS